MSGFRNNATLQNESGQQTVKRYSHQRLTTTHNDIKATIHENGKITISKPAGKDEKTGDILVDEVTIPASLVFKLAQLLKATRQVEFVPLADSHSSVHSED